MRALLISVALLGTLFVATPAEAQTPSSDEAARQHFESGRAYFDRARYTDAIREFEEAYRLSGRTGLLLNISRSYEANGDLSNAVVSLERWLELADATDPSRPEVEARLSRLRLTVEGRAAAEAADPEPDPQQASEPETTRVEAIAPSEPATTGGRSPAGLVIVAAGAALAGVGATFVVLGYRDIDTVERPASGSTWSDSASEYDRAPRRIAIGFSLVGLGVAAAVAGVVIRLNSGDDQTEPSVALRVSPTSLTVQGSF